MGEANLAPWQPMPDAGPPARNGYLRYLGAPDPGRYRQPLPGDPELPQLLPIGAIIRTSYGTGGRVTALEPWTEADNAGERRLHCWTIVYAGPGERKERECWINECVVHDGRILHLFEANDDEVFVIERPAAALPPPVPVHLAELPLFAWGYADA